MSDQTVQFRLHFISSTSCNLHPIHTTISINPIILIITIILLTLLYSIVRL